MELYPQDILIHIINIVVLYLLLRALLYQPVSRFMKARTARIDAEMEAAAESRRQAEAERDELKARLLDAQGEADAVVRQGSERAEAEAARLLAEAKAGAEAAVAQADAQIERDKRRAAGELRDETAQLAVEIASRILRREVRLEDNRSVVDDYFSEMKRA